MSLTPTQPLQVSNVTFSSLGASSFGAPQEHHPAFVVGRCVVRPLIDRVSHCASRIWGMFKSIDRSFQFPVAMGAKVQIRKDMELLEKIADHMSKFDTLSDAHKRMRAIIQEGEKTPDAPGMNFGVKAFEVMTDAIGFLSGPTQFILDAFIDGIRDGQIDIAIEEIEKLKKTRDHYNRQLDQALAEKGIKKEIRELRDRLVQVKQEIGELDTQRNGKFRTYEGVQKEMRDNFDKKDLISQKVEALKIWMQKIYAYFQKQPGAWTEYNAWFKQNQEILSDEQIATAIDANVNFQQYVVSMQPKVQRAVQRMNALSKQLQDVQDAIFRLNDYLKRLEADVDTIDVQIFQKDAEKSLINSQISQKMAQLSTHDEL